MIDLGALPTNWEVSGSEDEEEHDDTNKDLNIDVDTKGDIDIGGDEDSSSDSSSLIVAPPKARDKSMTDRRVTFTAREMKESFRSSRAIFATFTEVSNLEDSNENMRNKWMEVYNENIMKREEINRRKYSEFDWKQLLLLQDVKGNLLLHHACRRKALPETIRWLKGEDNDTVILSHKSHDGSLPIHAACRSVAPFSVIKLLMEDSDGNKYLNVRDGDGHLPLDLIGKGEAGAKKEDVKDGSLRLNNNPLFHSFLEDMFEYLIQDETSDQEDIFQCMDSLCNISPAKRFQKIVCKNLRSKTNIEWLTWAFCQPTVIAYVMRDFYCQIAWIVLIFTSADAYLRGKKIQLLLYALYCFALVFLVREIRQIRRYVKTDKFIEYLKDPWNWLDCSTIFLVTSSAITLQLFDPNNNHYDYQTRRLLMVTGACQVAHFVSYLRKIFLPFSAFVGGLAKVFRTLYPFIICTGLILLAFAHMYYVQNFNNPDALGELPYDSLWVSLQSVLLMFLDAPETAQTMVDALFGLVTTIILLNVVIGIVSIAWDSSTNQDVTQELFWEYRLAFVQDVTLSKNPGKKAKTAKAVTSIMSERFEKSRTLREQQMSEQQRLKRIILTIGHFIQYVTYFLLGLISFGLCWPDQIKKDIFGIKYQEAKEFMKPEIYETKRVHKLVSTKTEELERQMKEQADDNRFLMEQNVLLHEKVDKLESTIEKMSAMLSNIDEALKGQTFNSSSRSLRMLPSGEVQIISHDDRDGVIEEDGPGAKDDGDTTRSV